MSKSKERERLQEALEALCPHAPEACKVVQQALADLKRTNVALEASLESRDNEIQALKAEAKRLASLDSLETKNKELIAQMQLAKEQAQHAQALLQQARDQAKLPCGQDRTTHRAWQSRITESSAREEPRQPPSSTRRWKRIWNRRHSRCLHCVFAASCRWMCQRFWGNNGRRLSGTWTTAARTANTLATHG
jgi:hypothetical protein